MYIQEADAHEETGTAFADRVRADGGRGGIDWLVLRAFIESVKRGVQTPIDAYDTVTWMAIAPLSEISSA